MNKRISGQPFCEIIKGNYTVWKKNIVIQALTWVFLSLLIFIYWLPRMKTWETQGLWAIVAFLSWMLSRAGGNVALFYLERKSISIDHFASVFALIYIIPMIFQFNIFSSIFFGPYFIISIFGSIIIIHSIFKKRCTGLFPNILKVLSVGFLGSIFYWFLYNIIMDYSKNRYLYHTETGGIVALFLSVLIGVVVLLMQVFNTYIK